MTIDLGPANLDVLTNEGVGMKWYVEENKLNSGSIIKWFERFSPRNGAVFGYTPRKMILWN